MQARRESTNGAERLLNAAIDQFGRYGLDGASTRRIAAAAGVPMSQITYHFGGKAGLYLAAARHIAAEIGARVGTHWEAPQPADSNDPCEAVLTLLDRFAQTLLSPDVTTWALFIVREQLRPTAAFDELFVRTMGPALERLSALLIAASSGRCTPARARIKAIALVGQVLVFRLARAAVLRSTGWRDVGSRESSTIRGIVREHTSAILAELGSVERR